MRIAICDDEERELKHLLGLIAEYQTTRGISLSCQTFHSSTEFLCNIKGGEYDLILMDILMPGFTGIQAAHELRELDKNVKLIFLSSSPEFAIDSYSVGAYHYLLKPADAKTLFSLLDKIKSEFPIQREQGLVLKERGGIVQVPFTHLEYVEVMNKTVFFHLLDGIVREVTAALVDFEKELLAHSEFLKIHRSYIVNLSHIQSVSMKGVVTMSGHTIPLSRLQYNNIKDSYMNFLFQSESNAAAQEILEDTTSQKETLVKGPWQILLVDDEPDDLMLWSGLLRNHGCVVNTAENGRTALELASSHSCDCVLLDVMLPGEDGFSLCKKLRDLTHAPVIFLSCFSDTDKQVQGFESGGVDYITKDTPPALFWAKIESRISLASTDRTQLIFGPLLLDKERRIARIENTDLLLTSVEFEILAYLAEHSGHIFTLEEIFHIVWGEQPWDGGQLVQMHMSKLRRKLERTWEVHHFIDTVWGKGYRFVPSDVGEEDEDNQ